MNDVVTRAAVMETVVGARVPSAMAAQLEELAKRNERTKAGELRLALRRHLAANTQDFGPLQAA